jgi:L-lactate dehydrogenase (cytochrome)
MNVRDALGLIGLQNRWGRLSGSRLQACHSVADLRRLALRRTPRPVFDYVDGGADEELTLERNIEAFRNWDLNPVGPRDVSVIDTTTQLFERTHQLPLLCSPTGYTRMIHHSGENAVARAAMRTGVPYALSTVASTSIEELAATGHEDLWFQLYVWRDRDMTDELVDRAWAAGYRVLEVSIDVPVSGLRIRDLRSGLTIPPALSAATLLSIAGKPRYWINMLGNPPIRFANSPPGIGSDTGITIENMSAQFDPSVDWSDIAALRSRWPGKLVVKGPIGADAARAALETGVDGIHLSNHGGRQLDRCVPPLLTLPQVRAVVGPQTTLIVDSGIRSGTDLLIAIALGADAGAIGRVYLYGLMAAGEAGAEFAVRLIHDQLQRAMALLGVASVDEIRARGQELLSPKGQLRLSPETEA